MNEDQKLYYELGYRAGQIQALLDSIERKMDALIVQATPKPEPTAPPTRWWQRRPVWW